MNLRPAVAALALLLSTSAAAQTVYPAPTLRDLPTGGNVFGLLETAQPEIATDRFNSGGLNTADRDRMGAFLASWTQTLYRIGDVSVSSPYDGRAMIFPEVAWIDGVSASMWHTGAEAAAPGLTVAMRPRAPTSDAWRGSIEAMASGGSLARSSPDYLPPAITQLEHFNSVTGLMEGSAKDGRLHVMFGGASAGSTILERGAERHDARLSSGFLHANWRISDARSAQVLLWAQTHALHVQSTLAQGNRWRVFAALTQQKSESAIGDASLERLMDGPVSQRAASVERRDHQWNLGARGAFTHGEHEVTYGVDVDHGSMSADAFGGVIYESVNGIPARAWQFAPQAERSHRHVLDVATFAADHVTFSDRIIGDMAMRFSSAHGAARGASRGIGWNTIEPHLNLRMLFGTPLNLEAFIGVSRITDRLRLNVLAAGDPHAEVANVYRWDGITTGPLIARVGPGTGGDDSFSTIDPDIQRPATDELRIGAAAHPWASLRMSVTGIARRQRPLVNLVNTGVTSADYTVSTIPDPNGDLMKTDDDQFLPVYNRKPQSFGADRYRLTNQSIDASDVGVVIIAGEWKSEHVLVGAGGTAQFSVAPGVNRGYTAIENDPSLLGEAWSDPNANTYVRGQVFNDRAYTIKVMSVLNLPKAMTFGAIARYQDGQPFARVQIATGLNQGPEVIQAFGRGRSRFTYRSTFDVRLAKRLIVREHALDLVGEVYNLLKDANEVEEDIVTGPHFRDTTAVQPPRSFHLGLRVSF